MDFNKLKAKAIELKNKTINSAAKTLTESSITIAQKQNLSNLIEKSKTTSFKNKETGEEKKYKHKSIVIFAEEWSIFFKNALYIFPVISAKCFSQNIVFKLAKSKIEWVNLSDYNIETLPSLVVFEEEKAYKTISWEENILKLVKSFDLDINKLINEIK
jgi:hypothetical protein